MAYSLKPIVNNPSVWEPFLEYLEEEKQKALVLLVRTRDPDDIMRLQGEVMRLNKLVKLKGVVNRDSTKDKKES